jgi:hypothetical protein
MVGAQSVLARGDSARPSGSARAEIPLYRQGTVTYMYWVTAGTMLPISEHRGRREAMPGLHVDPIWDSGNYDTDLATKIGSGNARISSSSMPRSAFRSM